MTASSAPACNGKHPRTDSTAEEAADKLDSEVPMGRSGVIYHLGCKASDLADKIVLVGDPDRVGLVAEQFDEGSVTFTGTHREFRIVTGKYRGTAVSCMSTGIGTDNIEIAINEIHALKEYNPCTATWQADGASTSGRIHLIRLGSCGCPQPDVALCTLAVTRHALGLDNVGRFYEPPSWPDSVAELARRANLTTLGRVGVYTSLAHPDVTNALADTAREAGVPSIVGTTASGGGFYGCQGRAVGRFRGKLTVPCLVDELVALRLPVSGEPEEERVVNVEMEASAMCYLASLLGYKAGVACVIAAKRAGELRQFASQEDMAAAMRAAVPVVLGALCSL